MVFNLTVLINYGFFTAYVLRYFRCQTGFCSYNSNDDYINVDLYKGINWSGTRPYVYSKRVDLRVIVITLNRPHYLLHLLKSISSMEMDGDEMSVEVWIDRTKNQTLDKRTFDVCNNFSRGNNYTTIHVQPHHVGLYYQWIFTYSSDHLKKGEDEIFLILEDDLSISRFSYRFLKAVHKHFNNVPYYMGTTLRNLDVIHPQKSPLGRNDAVFMHRIFSTHAFSPKLEVWKNFQRWFMLHYKRPNFKPYVPNIAPTLWYKDLEKNVKSLTMWSIWMIYYTYIEQLFTVYPNPSLLYEYDMCFCGDSQAAGLHIKRRQISSCDLINEWNKDFIRFPRIVKKYEWNGKAYHSPYH